MHAALLGLMLLAAPQRADSPVSFPDRPPAGSYVVDEADLLDPRQESEISAIADEQMRLRRVPILVVTIRSLADHDADGYTIEQYARALFDEWGIGWQDHNYGMLLLVSRDDRQARIELGRSWAGSRDAAAGQLLDDLVIPEFRRQRYAAGLLAGTRGMRALAMGMVLPKPAVPWWRFLAIVAGVVFGIAAVTNLIWSRQRGWAWALLAGILGGIVALVFLVLRSVVRDAANQTRGDTDYYGGHEGESGGGTVLGGGSSGGGGATGRW